MARNSSYVYDPKTGSWTQKRSNVSTSTTAQKEAPKPSTQKKASKSSGSNLTASNTSKDTSTGSTEKQFNTIEYNILSGELQFIVTKETIKLNAGDTVRLDNLGKYLSGNYYVQDITRNISNTGYTHSATLIKTDFGDTLKSSSTSSNDKQVAKAPVAQPKPQQRVYYLKKGDSLWKVASKYYGSGAKYPTLAKANNISPSQYTRLPIGMKIIVP